MVRGAIATFFIDEFKTDITDATVSMHHIVVKIGNGDYDGDALHGEVIKELWMVPELMKIHPYTNLLTDQTLRISSIVNIGVQAVVNTHSWLKSGLKSCEGYDYQKELDRIGVGND